MNIILSYKLLRFINAPNLDNLMGLWASLVKLLGLGPNDPGSNPGSPIL